MVELKGCKPSVHMLYGGQSENLSKILNFNFVKS